MSNNNECFLKDRQIQQQMFLHSNCEEKNSGIETSNVFLFIFTDLYHKSKYVYERNH